jgi:hypothetical protein
LDGKKVCKPIKVGDPVDEGFKLMKDIRVDKTMVDGKATFKTININKFHFLTFLFFMLSKTS